MTRRLALAVALLAAGAARADLFSPGDLAKPHAHLEGLSQCTKCHPTGGQLSQGTCLACHAELQPRLDKGQGLHGRLPSEKRACEACHHDHQGRDHPLVDWGSAGKKGFDHRRAGWALKGGHAKVACGDCHEKRRITWPVALKLLDARPHTLLGLPTACEACHFDEHRGQQQEDCAYCHQESAWKPAPGFKHDETAYKLKGKHAKVKCSACHPSVKDEEQHGFPAPKSETFLRFADVPFGSCLDCHKDVHEGRFGLRCQGCHTPADWHLIRNASVERAFHDKTRYPLKGAHVDVDCKACHGPFPGIRAKFKKMAFEACTDCHADAHLGQLGGGKRPDCDTCHTVDGFTPARYGLPEHAKTTLPLEGAHAVVPCDACHPQTASLSRTIPRAVRLDLKKRRRPERFSLALFRFTKDVAACDSCHQDVHRGQLAKVAGGCAGCHQTASFSKVTFDHQKDSRYPLTGAHAKATCVKCHFATKPGAPVVYRPLETACGACHPDEHAGQFSVVTTGAKPATDCARYHGTDDYKVHRFQHQPPFTDFLLDGQHAKAACATCHPKVLVAPGVQAARYRPLPRACEGCHVDFHRGSFAGFEP